MPFQLLSLLNKNEIILPDLMGFCAFNIRHHRQSFPVFSEFLKCIAQPKIKLQTIYYLSFVINTNSIIYSTPA